MSGRSFSHLRGIFHRRVQAHSWELEFCFFLSFCSLRFNRISRSGTEIKLAVRRFCRVPQLLLTQPTGCSCPSVQLWTLCGDRSQREGCGRASLSQMEKLPKASLKLPRPSFSHILGRWTGRLCSLPGRSFHLCYFLETFRIKQLLNLP